MFSDNFHCNYWWLRTRNRELTIGRLHTDSEGADYFLIVGDGDRFYSRDEVQAIALIEHPPKNRNGAPAQIPKPPAMSQNDHPGCGDRVISFKGWRVYRCGKCTACRVNGHRISGTRVSATSAGGGRI
jgi:hypothetical protein